MTPTTKTFAVGRYTLSLTVSPRGRLIETWGPRPPVRLLPDELKRYHMAKSAYVAPPFTPIPAGAATRRNISGKIVAKLEAAE